MGYGGIAIHRDENTLLRKERGRRFWHAIGLIVGNRETRELRELQRQMF